MACNSIIVFWDCNCGLNVEKLCNKANHIEINRGLECVMNPQDEMQLFRHILAS